MTRNLVTHTCFETRGLVFKGPRDIIWQTELKWKSELSMQRRVTRVIHDEVGLDDNNLTLSISIQLSLDLIRLCPILIGIDILVGGCFLALLSLLGFPPNFFNTPYIEDNLGSWIGLLSIDVNTPMNNFPRHVERFAQLYEDSWLCFAISHRPVYLKIIVSLKICSNLSRFLRAIELQTTIFLWRAAGPSKSPLTQQSIALLIWVFKSWWRPNI